VHHGRPQRLAVQLHHPIVQPHPQRSDQRDLRAPSGIHREVGLLEVDPFQFLAIDAGAGRRIELHAENRDRRLQEHVAAARCERRQPAAFVLTGLRVLELDPDDQEPDADGGATKGLTFVVHLRADERGQIGERGGGLAEHHQDEHDQDATWRHEPSASNDMIEPVS
jgi:hypothetical protein